MKVRKEQFLLPKTKPTIQNGSKWIQANTKAMETMSSSIPSIGQLDEGLASALVTKIKPDFVLPTNEIIVSNHSGAPLIWHQQNGILRQALMSSDKDVKVEEARVVDLDGCRADNVISRVATNASLVAITTVNSQQLTSPQVIKMNDYQVILSGDNLPTSWSESGKNSMISTIPSAKTDPPGFVISNNQVSFATFTNVNVVNQSQIQAIMVSDAPSSDTSTVQKQVMKKIPIRPLGKSVKARRKPPTQVKKIALKPTSSLLSQTALENRNSSFQSETNAVYAKNVSAQTQFSMQNSSKPTVENSSLDMLSNAIVITAQSSSVPCESSNEKFSNSNDFMKDLLPLKVHEVSEQFNPSAVNVSSEQPIISAISTPCFVQNNSTLTGSEVSVISGGVLIDSDTEVTCVDDNELLHAEVVEETHTLQNSIHSEHVLRNGVFHRAAVAENILPSDMEHHTEHHTQEYTDNLLSQLSNSRVLPNMSCSQVTSVLNALNKTNAQNFTKESKEQLKCEPTEFVKVESSQALSLGKSKQKQVEPRFHVCEVNEHQCYRCVDCMFLSLKSDLVDSHWAEEHQTQVDNQPSKLLTITCLGCPNVFYSKHALQVHLVCDHNVDISEVTDLLNLTISANTVEKESTIMDANESTSLPQESSSFPEAITTPVEILPTATTCYQSNVASVITQTTSPLLTPSTFLSENIACSEPPKVDSHKEDSSEIPPTPNFSLFSDIDIPPGKEVVVTTEYPAIEVDADKLIREERQNENLQGYKSLRSKLKAEYGSDIKFNYRCMVERCGVRLSSELNLDYHLRCHKPDTDTLTCPECDVCFTNWPTLTLHLWREHKINMDLYSCIHCDYKTNSFSKLLNNHVKIHGDRKDYICNICNKGFKTGKQLRNHKVIHRIRHRYEADRENPDNGPCDRYMLDFKCDICSRSFTDSRILKLHTENVHNKARPYLCTFCNHTASSKSSLRMHIRQHTGEKPFSCDECEYITGDHNSLRRHKMRHSGKRPYHCPHCSYSCIQATTYKVHLKSKHPGLDEGLMFSCPMCPFRTIKKDNYMTHKAEHDLGGEPRHRRKKLPPNEIIQIETGEFIMPTEV